MKNQELEELKNLLKQAIPPMGESELPRDLWPLMLKRFPDRSVRVPWWDWALLCVASLLMLLFPGMIPALLYHL